MPDLTILEALGDLTADPHAWVYVIHFHTPLKHARHYYGMAHTGKLLVERLTKHATGHRDSAALMRAVHGQGIGWTLADLRPFDTTSGALIYERSLKNLKSTWGCPLCKQILRRKARERMRALRLKRKGD